MRWIGQRNAHPSLPIEAFEPGGRPANMLIRGTRRNAPRRRTAIVANRDGFGAWGRGAEFPELRAGAAAASDFSCRSRSPRAVALFAHARCRRSVWRSETRPPRRRDWGPAA